ncbi:MAG TPA: hypothetical protein VLJ39_15425 [Tepidisphaeraceae bacterium]|nr:hypothetical protein [Tepidisphaeraceae bacterium]
MTSHPIFVLLTAVLLSLALAMLDRREPRERLYVAARTLLCCIGSTVAGGWLMRLIHG